MEDILRSAEKGSKNMLNDEEDSGLYEFEGHVVPCVTSF